MSDVSELSDEHAKLSLGQRMMMLDHVWKKFGLNRKSLDDYRSKMLGSALGESTPAAANAAQSAGGEKMLDGAMVLGNVTVQQPSQAAPHPTGMSTAAKLAMAAIVAAGLGTPIGAGLYLANQDQPTTVQPATDTDTVIDVYAGRPTDETQ